MEFITLKKERFFYNKEMSNVQKIFILNKCFYFELFLHQRIVKEKIYQGFHKNIKQHSIYNNVS